MATGQGMETDEPLTQNDWVVIRDALLIAAEQYTKDAGACAATPRVADQFVRQADRARRLAARVDSERVV